MANKLKGRFFSQTDIGKKRATNDDQAIAMINHQGHILLAVCDGMGGHNKGNFASFAAIELLKERFGKKRFFFNSFLTKLWIKRTISIANSIIYKKAKDNDTYKGTGTTLSVALISPKHVTVAQIGDSRVYSLNKKGQFSQLTEDQTVAMHEYHVGHITESQIATHPKRHILTNALGIHKKVELEIKTYPYNKESILVCSDGLYNNASPTQIKAILDGGDTIEQKVFQLISQANFNGGSDNIAVCIWEVER